MINIIDKSKCSGCSACMSVCPVQCIGMEPDGEGFLYPKIIEKSCIGCGKCEKVCPVLNLSYSPKSSFPKAYLTYDDNLEERIASAAGGAFTAVARNFIEKYQGIVFGAAYREDFSVHHIGIETIEELSLLQKSKYVQSDMEDCYTRIHFFLKQGRYVLFSGTACQIYGLKSYLGCEYEKLYCIDVICYGVPSPKIFCRYLEFMSQKYGHINKVIVRDKEIKRKRFQMGYGILFQSGFKYFARHSIDPMARIFYGKIASRPICYKCPYKTIWRISDLTIGDCWYGSEFIPGYVDRYGITLALCQSDKGMKLLINNKYIVKYEVPTEEIAKVNGGMLYSSCQKPNNREQFFLDAFSMEFGLLADKYFPIKREAFKSRIRRWLIDLGLLPEVINHKVRQKNIQNMIKNRVIPSEAKSLAELKK